MIWFYSKPKYLNINLVWLTNLPLHSWRKTIYLFHPNKTVTYAQKSKPLRKICWIKVNGPVKYYLISKLIWLKSEPQNLMWTLIWIKCEPRALKCPLIWKILKLSKDIRVDLWFGSKSCFAYNYFDRTICYICLILYIIKMLPCYPYS